MARTHTWLFEDRFSSTAYGQFFWNQSWLSQLIFYGLFLAGGLPLLTLVCAAAIVTAWAILWRLVHGPLTDRLVLVAVALASATVTWSVRPQAFSLLLTMIVVSRATTDRWRALPWLFLVWANLHAGFVMGIALLVATVLSALMRDRNRFWTRAWWTAACGLATLLTPLGVKNWTEVAASVMRSRANAIQEWQPTAPPPQQLAFWALAVLLVILVVRSWRRLETPADRALAMAALVVLPLAVRSLRNVPAFVMVGAPAASRLLFPAATTRFTRADRDGSQSEPRPGASSGTAAPPAPQRPPRIGCRSTHGGHRRNHGMAPAMANARMGADQSSGGGGHQRLPRPPLQHLRGRRADHLVRAVTARVHRQPPGSVSGVSDSASHRGRADW